MVRPESEKQGSWNRGKTATDECAALRECVNDLHSLLKELAHAEIVSSEESGTESVQLSDQLQALMRKIEAAEEAVQLTAEWRPQDPQTGIASYEKITLCEKQFEATMFAWYRYRQTIDFWCRKQGTEAAYDSSFEKTFENWMKNGTFSHRNSIVSMIIFRKIFTNRKIYPMP